MLNLLLIDDDDGDENGYDDDDEGENDNSNTCNPSSLSLAGAVILNWFCTGLKSVSVVSIFMIMATIKGFPSHRSRVNYQNILKTEHVFNLS